MLFEVDCILDSNALPLSAKDKLDVCALWGQINSSICGERVGENMDVDHMVRFFIYVYQN